MIKIGIIGVGRIGKVHAQSITRGITNAKVLAVADPFMNAETERWAHDLGIEHCYKDYKDILANPEIDAVMICSSTDTHADISIEAIKAKKHVFCEKPISQDIAKIKEVMKALEGSGLKYQVGFNRRFDHNFEAVRKSVRDGLIGDVHIVKITSRDPAPPPAEYVKVSGGMFLDMTIHDFDMVRYLTGADVVEVFANGAVLVDPAIGKAGDIDTAIITLKMSNGALAVIDNSRKAAYGYDQRAEVFGSKGQAAVTNDSESTLVLSTENGVTGEKPLYFFLERYMASFTKEVSLFVKAIEENSAVPVDINDGLQPVLIATAALKSLQERRPVLLSEIQ
ncbi:inositol 2-dehydrogenase [Treponema phagedenis]|uniref:Inositol 2-dehydrogenase n=1 Tax=Treponema phagedenis TaxID=162 RepID=A0A0B7H1R4_TREPH|nr:inositol 2-dehydrogenase [Treponema phagedenis]NVP23705.1 inositol 2-dehydrogenase [Treponema phagedenis]QEJ94470.1 inositol 2-dehydrogenase [Treponema phagedenis]QEJ97537.1 inositol 2-dehydrogenase [Treponema phagedenis]QEK01649.1 inositol 2-dehydrogenase [Treponema phagedenis]QEK03104.1 inositol 2-dehydrogenase [Treponema phagedenis]